MRHLRWRKPYLQHREMEVPLPVSPSGGSGVRGGRHDLAQELGVLRVPHCQRTRVPVYFDGEVVPGARSERCAKEDVQGVVEDLERVRIRGRKGTRRVGERGT